MQVLRDSQVSVVYKDSQASLELQAPLVHGDPRVLVVPLACLETPAGLDQLANRETVGLLELLELLVIQVRLDLVDRWDLQGLRVSRVILVTKDVWVWLDNLDHKDLEGQLDLVDRLETRVLQVMIIYY